jgi:mannitol-1-phosphate/altronate dehydrogenase
MEKELRPTLEVIEGIENIDLDKYQEVLIHRFSNEIIADTLLRVAMDTSDKLSVQVWHWLRAVQCL